MKWLAIAILVLCISARNEGAYAQKGKPDLSSRPHGASDTGKNTAPNAASPQGSSSPGSGGLGHLVEPNEVVCIEMEKDNPGVMIGSGIYHVNDEAFGGRIVAISKSEITVKFKDKKKNFGVGDFVAEK